MKITLSKHEKEILSRIGHGAYGRELMDILDKAKGQVCSLEGIHPGGDHTAEVEGRLLFRDFVKEIVQHLSHEKRPKVSEEDRRGHQDFS